MSVKVLANELSGVGNRMFFLIRLPNYYDSTAWKERRIKKMKSVNWKSEVSDLLAEVVHHITYPFKNDSDFNDKSLWGSEKDYQLMALTRAEHEVVHSVLQHVAHKPRKLLKELKAYFRIL